eukprot:8411466-Pyramimonas_sp.AAC.1
MGGMSAGASRAMAAARTMCGLSAGVLLAGSTMYGRPVVTRGAHVHAAARVGPGVMGPPPLGEGN